MPSSDGRFLGISVPRLPWLCGICERVMSADPSSGDALNCGGDCLGCVRGIEDREAPIRFVPGLEAPSRKPETADDSRAILAMARSQTVVVCESCSSPLCARGSEVCDDFLFAGLVNVLAPSGDES